MNNRIKAKAKEIENMNQDQLDKLKQDMGMSKDLDEKSKMYLYEKIDDRQFTLDKRSNSMCEMSEVKQGEI